MEKDSSENKLSKLKNVIIQELCDEPLAKQTIKESVPDFLKPYAHINPYSPDAEQQIEEIMNILHPKAAKKQPDWIQKLIDKGLVDEDGRTVIAKSLESVASEIMKNNIQVTNVMLKRFVNGKTNKPYSMQSINLVIELANSK